MMTQISIIINDIDLSGGILRCVYAVCLGGKFSMSIQDILS